MEENLDFLKQSALFTGLHEGQFAVLCRLAEIQKFQEGEVIVAEGTPGDRFFVLMDGEVSIEKNTPEGYPRPLASLTERGAFFGEMAVVDIEPRSATARAFKRTSVVMFTKEALVTMFDEFPELMTLVGFNIARVLSQRLRSIDEDLAALSG
ncbi:Crp/Fnr family transcriptional regulator [Candidatus Zixiibacteriota bacterium]